MSPLVGLVVAVALGSACTGESASTDDGAEAGAGADDGEGPSDPTVPTLDLWEGVPPLTPLPDDIASELKPRPDPLKPPSVHETIETPLRAEPSEATAVLPPPTAGPLEVERHGPTGPQTVVDAVRVAFNQPMVPLTDVTALKAAAIPLTIEPAVPGEVKWLGTRTLAFVPEAGRMPASTEYTVTIPAGATSTWGESLASDFRWTFATPTLQLRSSTPWEGTDQVELEPTIFLEFDQAIERTALVAAITLSGRGDRMGVKLAPVPKTGAKPADVPEWKAARQVRVVPERALRPDTRYTLKIPAGVYGEGPEKSAPISLSFSTYPPLTVRKEKCWGTCWADHGITLTTSNPLSDPDVASKVHVDPEPPNLQVSAAWSGISLQGDFEGRTRYRVTVDAGLRDTHGQTLARPFSTAVTLGPPYPSVSLSRGVDGPVVIERAATKEVELRIGGIEYLEVQARAMDIDGLPAFLDAYPYDWGWPSHYAPKTYDLKVPTPGAMKHREPLRLDLGPAMDPDHHHLWMIARSNPVTRDGWTQREGISMLVEVTDLGVAAVLDHETAVVQVSHLSTGEPVLGAAVQLLSYAGDRVYWTGTTDADGLAWPSVGGSSSAALIVVRTADDDALLRIDRGDLRGRWRSVGTDPPEDYPRAFMYTDRTPYKPGDTVHLAGILRKETRGPDGGVEMWLTDFVAQYVVTNPRGIEVAKGEVKIGRLGTFSVEIPTKEEHGTGDFSFRMTVPSLFGNDRSFHHAFPVETYRAPEFQVMVEREDSTPLVFGDTLETEIHGEYLFGAPLVGGQVQYVLQRTTTDFQPPGSLNEGFRFGRDQGYGYGYGLGRGYRYGYGGLGYWGPSYVTQTLKTGEGQLDAQGRLPVTHTVLAVEPPPEGSPAPDPAATKPTEPEGPPMPATYSLQATVTDDNRQAIAGQGSWVVHPARVYVGLRAARTVLHEGERAELEAVLVDLEGERVIDRPITVTLVRRETTRKAVEKDGRWIYETETTEHEAGQCALDAGLSPSSCDLTVAEAGTYVARGTATDADGHETLSELRLYVHGEDAVVWENTEHRVDLVPDRREYRPGDVATVLVRSPFDTAHGVVVVEREGIDRTIPVRIEGGATTVEITIEEQHNPSLSVSALLTRGRVEVPGAPAGQDLGMPAAATGQVQLPVSSEHERIEIALEPSARELSPGDTMTLTIDTTNQGEAVPAAIAVMVVDEGVLSLMGHQTPDPLSFFHHARGENTWLYALQAAVLARDVPPPVAATAPTTGLEATGELGLMGTGRGGGGVGPGGGFGLGGMVDDVADAPMAQLAAPMEPEPDMAKEEKRSKNKDESSRAGPAKPKPAMRRSATIATEGNIDASVAMAQPISLREVFATTAFFDAEILTDANGHATVEIPMPENLTTFRVMVVAVDPNAPDRFGHGDTTVRVRKPLMLRPSLPRFANFGDRFEASVMVDNQTGSDQQVMVGTRGLNVQLPSEAETLVRIPAGESREVRFDMETAEVGTMRLQFAALSNGGRDATELSLPVHYPATAEAFADYGMIPAAGDGATERTVIPPADALSAFGGLEISMSSTALSGLEDAVDYLVTYPYECAEQTASRILPIFALSTILDEFPVAGLHDRMYRDRLAHDGIERLLAKQNYDGGFGYWVRGESWPYLSNWVTLALLEGKRAGFAVDAAALERALSYVENFVRYGHRTRWGLYYDWTSRAVGLYLLSGESRGAALFDRVWEHRDEMPLYARAMLMAAAHRYGRTSARDEVLDELRDGAVESPKTVHFAEGRSEADADGLRVLMHSSVQTDAIALMALLEVTPSDPMLPKVMAGIMADRDPKKGGRWGTTHANAWALLAADRYYETVEGIEPDYTARVWLDGQLAGDQRFAGRSMTSVARTLPMAQLQTTAAGTTERSLVIGKQGAGPLYYRMGLRYAPEDLQLPAEDQGFLVYREYEALPDPSATAGAGEDAKAEPDAVQRTEDGGWVVKAGTNVKVTITVVARDRANYVVVDDALPAGFEGQNPRFLTSVAARNEASRSRGVSDWWWPWWSFDHTDLRDDRMLLFADHMPAGVYTYSYTARATTIGEFQLPPVKAEAMYEPERFGHGASSTVRVVE